MLKQFFGKTFWITLIALAVVFGLSVVAFESIAVPVLLVAIMVTTFALSLKNLHLGLLIAFAELFANSHGHLLSVEVVGGFQFGLRMAIFVAVMSAWLILFLARRTMFKFRDARLTPFLVLFAAIIIGFLNGYFQNDLRDVFSDGNAYFYVAYILPILSIEWDRSKQRMLLQVLIGSAAWVITLTLGLLFIFTHVPPYLLSDTYTFIRDTRTGELTEMTAGIFRIFIQAQFSVILAIFFLAPFLWMKKIARRDWLWLGLFMALGTAAILISLSRSFWVGIIAASLVFLGLVIKYLWPGYKMAGAAMAKHAGVKVLSVIILIIVVLFPMPFMSSSLSSFADLFASRTTETTDQAIDSRWKLLPPMVDSIKSDPLTGHGFGTKLEFISEDPRVRAINPDGKWITYSFEWGWLELWIKMGILGPAAFLALFVLMIKGLWSYLSTEKKWLSIALISCLAFLFATHVFSPYLNHPLGLGLILFIIPFLPIKKLAPEPVGVLSPSAVLKRAGHRPAPTPGLSRQRLDNLE
ncbi:O-antigen ligase family protein [Patescibacteria group bacterium]